MVLETFKTFKWDRSNKNGPYKLNNDKIIMSVDKKAEKADETTIKEDIVFRVEDGNKTYILTWERFLDISNKFKDITMDYHFKFNLVDNFNHYYFKTHEVESLTRPTRVDDALYCNLQSISRATYSKTGRIINDVEERKRYNFNSKFGMWVERNGEDKGDYVVIHDEATFNNNRVLYHLIKRGKFVKTENGPVLDQVQYGLSVENVSANTEKFFFFEELSPLH